MSPDTRLTRSRIFGQLRNSNEAFQGISDGMKAFLTTLIQKQSLIPFIGHVLLATNDPASRARSQSLEDYISTFCIWFRLIILSHSKGATVCSVGGIIGELPRSDLDPNHWAQVSTGFVALLRVLQSIIDGTQAPPLADRHHVLWACEAWDEFTTACGMDMLVMYSKKHGCGWFKCPLFGAQVAAVFGQPLLSCSRCGSVRREIRYQATVSKGVLPHPGPVLQLAMPTLVRIASKNCSSQIF